MPVRRNRSHYAATTIATITLLLTAVWNSRIDAAFLINTNTRTSISSRTTATTTTAARSTGTTKNNQNIILQTESSSSSGDTKPKKSGTFTLSSLFGGGSTSPSSSSTTASTVKHPSVRSHRSPLNLLSPDNKHIFPELPVHPEVTSGVLDNGLSYVILPNRSPPGRFEAHLQVFSGSADELESQQGIAHLTEHVAYMGSRKRERLFGTGSQTNAYTDFHHTVFYAACPTILPGSRSSSDSNANKMLPLALDALADVMEARVEPSRLEKERAAVLSEMTMVNTIEYRVECQILSALHRENRLSKRFPIGKEILIKNWKPSDVKSWHRTHYRPDNVLLYIVGDIADKDGGVSEVIQTIQQKFGHITADKQAVDISPSVAPEASQIADALNAATVKAKQSWHYPPVIHEWCVDEKDDILKDVPIVSYDIHLRNPMPLDEKVDFLPETKLTPNGIRIRPHIFRHELLQSFSMHLFAKRPVQPIVDLPSFRHSLARRVALAALQIRLNVGGRSDDPPFSFVEFNQLDSAREGCAVCSLDLTASSERWKDAVQIAISEIRKLGLFGVTSGEMERYTSALLTDSAQLAAQGDRISHGDQLAYLMETVANGHTFMSPEQSYTVTEQALSTLTLEEVNHAAKELCSHVLGLTPAADDDHPQNGVVVVVACTPKSEMGDQDPNYCNEENLIQCIRDACAKEISPVEDVHVPHTLIPPEELKEALEKFPATWEEGRFTDGTPNTPADKFTRPFTLRRLNNGIRVGIAQNSAESHRGFLRLVAPGGRNAEKCLGLKPGSMSVGARTMQEGGAFGPWTREQVELFCVDHLLMVEINCSEESIIIDFVFPTTNVGNTGFGENMELGITGTEATMQIVREILIGFKWEEDALGRSKQSFRSAHDGLQKNLEGLTTERIMEALTNNDSRFLSIDTETVNSITLEDAKKAVMSQLLPPDLEVSIVGDFDVVETMEMVRQYLGTIPAYTNSEYHVSGERLGEFVGAVPPLPLESGKRHIELELTDSDPRAVAYVAGRAPNMWGFLEDGTSVPERIMSADKSASEYDKKRRSHPLFANAALSLLSEIVNRRLFSNVRERKQLTYDANFSLTGFERLLGGWFLVTVTASKEKAQAALDACKETLETLRKSQPITEDNLESAKRVVLNRHDGELRTARYWAEMMSGLQQESIPLKGPLSITDFHAIVESITTKDLQLCLECLGLDEKQLYTAIGKTVQPAGVFPEKEKLVKASPMAGMTRGGPLFN